MLSTSLIWFSLMLPGAIGAPAADPPPFRFQLFAEPVGLDPVTSRGASGNYLYHALYRGLFVYRGDDGLKPAGASLCRRSSRRLTCTLRDGTRFSDGRAVVAADYVRAFRRVIDPAVASPHADLLFALARAEDVHAGGAPVSALGVRAEGARTITFDFARDDYEFEYKLIHPALSPDPPGGFPDRAHAERLVASGVYRIGEWRRDARVSLIPNPHRPGASARPPAEALFVDEDATALSLFETGKLGFMRRLIASEIARFRGRPEFHQVPQARFDYVGFGPELESRSSLRDALTKGVDYAQFLRLFDTRTPPGCISLPRRYLDRVECLTFDRAAIKTPLPDPPTVPLEFYFSRLGGDDIQRAAEWFAAQWKKNLNLTVTLRPEEQTSFLARLRRAPPALFRKGAGLDRPTCLAALEMFEPGNADNYPRLNDPAFTRAVGDLRRSRTESARRRTCARAVRALLATRRVIPLGEMMFTLLVDPRFSGWDLNEINQLDFGRLVRREKVQAHP